MTDSLHEPPDQALPSDDVLGRLASRRLIVVTGKGGVGKSALTAVLGRCLANRGRRTLILEVDPRENLHQLLDVPPSGGEAVEVAPNLMLQNLKPRQVVDRLVERQMPMKLLARRVLASPIYQRFVEGAPGLEPMAILGHAMSLVQRENVETVVLDAPATGHGIYLLTAPRLFETSIGQGPMGQIAGEVAAFVADPENCGLVVVTLAEEMPCQEALELRESLEERFGRSPELLVVNSVYPVLGDSGHGKDPLRALWSERRAMNEREIARLEAAWSGPRAILPMLAADRGPDLIQELTDHLGSYFEGEQA